MRDRTQLRAMQIGLFSCLIAAAMGLASSAAAEDQRQKAEIQIRKVSALAFDKGARPFVSETVAEFLKIPRMDLVRERQSANLSYGSLFLVHRLTDSPSSLEQMVSEVHAGKSLWDIGSEKHADWQQIARDAKKLNEKIEAALYDYFLNGPPDPKRHPPDGYDVVKDRVAADGQDLTKQELEAAQDTYVRCYQRVHGWGQPKDLPNQNNRDMPNTEGDPR